jgi:hypothetical protein
MAKPRPREPPEMSETGDEDKDEMVGERGAQVGNLCYGVVVATGRRDVLPAEVVLIRETMSRIRSTP